MAEMGEGRKDYNKVNQFLHRYIMAIGQKYGATVMAYDVVVDAVDHWNESIAVDINPHGFIKKSPWSLIDLKVDVTGEERPPIYLCTAVKLIRVAAPGAQIFYSDFPKAILTGQAHSTGHVQNALVDYLRNNGCAVDGISIQASKLDTDFGEEDLQDLRESIQ